MHYIIGFFGASESGKGLCSSYLVNELQSRGVYRVVEAALASPLKRACSILGFAKGDPLFRRVITGIDDIIRPLEDGFLWRLFQQEILVSCTSPTVIVLNDPRYQIQAAKCDYTVKLVRPNSKSRMDSKEAAHATEMEWERIVTNVTYDNIQPDDPYKIAVTVANTVIPILRERGFAPQGG